VKNLLKFNGLFVLVALLLAGTSAVAQGVYRGNVSGSADSLTLTATLPTTCAGRNIYVVAVVPGAGNFACTGPNQFVPWTGGEIPRYAGSAAGDGTYLIIAGLDIHPFPGTDVYAGCGTSTSELIAQARYAKIMAISP